VGESYIREEVLPDGGYVRSCAGVDGRKVGYGSIRYGGCYLIVHSSSENSACS